MKNLLISICLILGLLPVLNAQKFSDSTYKVIGFNSYYTNSDAGYGRSLNMNISIEKHKRHLEIGVILQEQTAIISGGEIIYKHYLSNFVKNGCLVNPHYCNWRIFFQYNFVFRNNTLSDRLGTGPLASDDIVVAGGRVATYEHYAGLGVQVRLFDKIFLNGGLGYGVILGSADEKFSGEPHYTMGGNKNDFGMSVRFGLGYFLTRN